MSQVIQLAAIISEFIWPGNPWGTAVLIASGVYGAEQARKAVTAAQQAAKDAYNSGLQDRLITSVATDTPFRYAYGRVRVGSVVVAMFSSGSNDQYKHLVCVHAAHECDAIEEIYINGIALGALDGNGDVTGGNYSVTATLANTELQSSASFSLAYTPVPGSVSVSDYVNTSDGLYPAAYAFTLVGTALTITDPAYVPGTQVNCAYQYQTITSRVRVQKHLGTVADPADATLLAEVPGKWSSTSVLRNMCYTVVRLDLNQSEFQSGLPSVEVLLRGKKLFDPRDSSTLWSQNNALAIYDYLTSEMCGVAAADLPGADYIAAANVCSAITGCTYAQSGTSVVVTKTAHGLLVNDVREIQILTGAPAAATITLTIAAPTVVNWTSHGLSAGSPFIFGVSGSPYLMPVGVTTAALNADMTVRGPIYYVLASGLTSNSFQFSTTPGGQAVMTTGTQSGVLTAQAILSGHYLITAATANTFTYTAPTSLTASGNATVGGLYTLNGTVTADQDQSKTLEAMAQSMAGFIVATTWSISAGKYIAPVKDLLQSDIVGSLSVMPGTSDANLYNGVKGSFACPANSYVATDFAPYQNATYLASDGRELWTNIDFAFTDQAQRIRNLCTIFTDDQRNGFSVTASFSLKTWALQIGQRVTLTSAFLGQTAKVYRVTDKKYAPDSSVELSLKEDVYTIWDFDGASVVDSTPNTNLPNPFALAPLASLTCLSDITTVLVQSDGTLVPRILASWPVATTQAVVTKGTIELEWQRVGSATWNKISVSGADTQTYLSPAQVGAFYMVRARTVNPYLNIKSDWVYVAHQVAVSLPLPANVIGFSVAQNNSAVTFKWAKLPSVTIKGYDIGYAPQGTSDWAHFTMLTEAAKGTEMTNAAVPPGTWVFAIRARDVINQLSPLMATQNLIVTNPNLNIIHDVEEVGWTGAPVGLIEHYTGVLVPLGTYPCSHYYAWEDFNQWVPDPVTFIQYTTPVVDAGYDEALRVYDTVVLPLGVGQTGTPAMSTYIDTWLTAGSDLNAYVAWVIGVLTMRFIRGRISATIAQGNLFMVSDYTLCMDMSPVVESPPQDISVTAPNSTVTNFPSPYNYPPFVLPVVKSGAGTSVTASSITKTGCIFHIWQGSTEVSGTLTYTSTGE